ncbi:hypothetical protein F5Y19DRAFT_277849 [Xylariaceae sp. FL1651]|nr:hypothetical protein F5Y19DRAFT_277849 [Xylariaceae sp. FL1651]
MPFDSNQLAKEVGKLAKLGAVQNSLPGALRAVPVAAIALGTTVSHLRDKEGHNVIENLLLGKETTVTELGAPESQIPTQQSSDNKVAISDKKHLKQPDRGLAGPADTEAPWL